MVQTKYLEDAQKRITELEQEVERLTAALERLHGVAELVYNEKISVTDERFAKALISACGILAGLEQALSKEGEGE